MRRRSKYGVSKFPWRGITYDSKAEAARHEVLRAKERRGEIVALHYHGLRFYFEKDDRGRAATYQPDFNYIEDGMLIAEEVKGVRVRDWSVRAALFKTAFPEWELRVIEV